MVNGRRKELLANWNRRTTAPITAAIGNTRAPIAFLRAVILSGIRKSLSSDLHFLKIAAADVATT